MARYVHVNNDIEYSTGVLIFAFVFVSFLGVILAGAIAAIPVLFGAIEAGLWIWSILGGLWTGLTAKAALEYRSESRKLPR